MITSATQKGCFIYIHNEGNSRCGTIECGSDARLIGFTPQKVKVKEGKFIRLYDERGSRISKRHSMVLMEFFAGLFNGIFSEANKKF